MESFCHAEALRSSLVLPALGPRSNQLRRHTHDGAIRRNIIHDYRPSAADRPGANVEAISNDSSRTELRTLRDVHGTRQPTTWTHTDKFLEMAIV